MRKPRRGDVFARLYAIEKASKKSEVVARQLRYLADKCRRLEKQIAQRRAHRGDCDSVGGSAC